MDQILVFKSDYRSMLVKSITECSEHSAILSTFIKLPSVIKIFALSIFEWLLKAGYTVFTYNIDKANKHLLNNFTTLKTIKDQGIPFSFLYIVLNVVSL